MDKRFRNVTIGLLVVAMGVLCWFVLLPDPVPNPSAKGKRLSEWLREMTPVVDPHTGLPTRSTQAREAIKSMGTNAMPYLLRETGMCNTPVDKCAVWWNKRGYLFNWPVRTGDERRQAAILADMAVGRDMFPFAVQGLTNASAQTRLGAQIALLCVRQSSPKVTQLLTQLLDDKDLAARCQATITLSLLEKDDEIAVPPLIRMLGDKNINMQEAAANALRVRGTNSQAAVPTLVKLLTDSRPKPPDYVILEALKQIDPDAAKRAGY